VRFKERSLEQQAEARVFEEIPIGCFNELAGQPAVGRNFRRVSPLREAVVVRIFLFERRRFAFISSNQPSR
jgi:hypothetical protein